MGIFGSLFESKEEEAKRQRTAARKLERAVERVVDNLADRIKDMERECSNLWKEAKTKLQSGQKQEASRILKMYKSKDVMITRLDRQKTFVEFQLNNIRGARDMQTAMGALSEMATSMNLSVDGIEDSLENIDFVNADISDINKTMDKAFEKSMAQLDREADALSSEGFDESLMTALEIDAWQEISGGLGNPVNNNVTEASTGNADIAAGAERLKKILNEKP